MVITDLKPNCSDFIKKFLFVFLSSPMYINVCGKKEVTTFGQVSFEQWPAKICVLRILPVVGVVY